MGAFLEHVHLSKKKKKRKKAKQSNDRTGDSGSDENSEKFGKHWVMES